MTILFDSTRPINAPAGFGSRRPRARPKAEAPDVCRLTLAIRGVAYAVRRVACDPSIGSKAFRLRRADGTTYYVLQDPHGPTCDCPDYVWRHDGLDSIGCKHVRALSAVGLLGEGRPR